MEPSNVRITTRTLTRCLLRTSSFERWKARYGGEMQTPTLPAYVKRLCEERGVTHEQIIKRACLDRVYGHQIFAGIRRPARDKVLQIAFGFGMDTEEAQSLLKVAQKSALYPRIERDAAILFCLNRGMSVVETQMMLSDLRLPLLGKEHNLV